MKWLHRQSQVLLIRLTDLQAGLTALEAFDEPTLILFPEGQALDASLYFGLISLAIDQCANLQDRFTLVDVHTQLGSTHATIVDGFREDFPKNDSLNYAAAYYPNLRTLFDYKYSDDDVMVYNTASPGFFSAKIYF